MLSAATSIETEAGAGNCQHLLSALHSDAPALAALAEADQVRNTGITELVLASERDPLRLLLAMIAQMTEAAGDQWVSFIAPEEICDLLLEKNQLHQAGVSLKHLRIVRAKAANDVLWMSWEALSLGNSHTVVAWTGEISELAIQQLENAANMGGSEGLVLRFRQN